MKSRYLLALALFLAPAPAQTPGDIVQQNNVSFFVTRFTTALPGVPAPPGDAREYSMVWINSSDPETVAYRVTVAYRTGDDTVESIARTVRRGEDAGVFTAASFELPLSAVASIDVQEMKTADMEETPVD